MAAPNGQTRRALCFDSLDAVIADAEELRTRGYAALGKWDLAQVCNHLADWLSFPLDGFPKAPAPIRLMLWMVRKTVGRKKLLTYIRTKSFPAGKPTMPQTVHAAGEDVGSAIERLRVAAERWARFNGTVHPSPLFGPMSKEEAIAMQLVHSAHHLSFLVPK